MSETFLVPQKVFEYVTSDSFKKCKILTDRQILTVSKRIIEELSYNDISYFLNVTRNQARNIFIKSVNRLDLFLNDKTPSTLIKDTNLSKRIKNALSDVFELNCIEDLKDYPEADLLKLQNLGERSVEEIKEYLKDYEFSLKVNTNIPNIFRFSKEWLEKLEDEDILRLISKFSEFIIKRRNKK